MSSMPAKVWIDACAHRLQRQCHGLDPGVLEEVAADLWRDPRLRAMTPTEAAIDWPGPVATDPLQRSRSALGEAEQRVSYYLKWLSAGASPPRRLRVKPEHLMDRIESINRDRIRWCAAERGVSLDELATEAGVPGKPSPSSW